MRACRGKGWWRGWLLAGLGLIGWLTITAPAAWSRQVVRMASDDAYPPYSYVDAQGAAGLYVRIVEAVFAHLPDYELQISPMPWKLGLRQLQAGEILGLIAPYRRPALRPWMAYSTALYQERPAVFCHDKVAAKLREQPYPTGFSGLRFANNSGFSIGGEAFARMVLAGDVTIEEVASTELNLRRLTHGQVDCYISDREGVNWEWRHMMLVDPDLQRHFQNVRDLEPEDVYLGLTSAPTFPFQAAFVAAFNTELAKLQANGEIARIAREVFAGQ